MSIPYDRRSDEFSELIETKKECLEKLQTAIILDQAVERFNGKKLKSVTDHLDYQIDFLHDAMKELVKVDKRITEIKCREFDEYDNAFSEEEDDGDF